MPDLPDHSHDLQALLEHHADNGKMQSELDVFARIMRKEIGTSAEYSSLKRLLVKYRTKQGPLQVLYRNVFPGRNTPNEYRF